MAKAKKKIVRSSDNPTDNLKRLGNRIKELRKKKGYESAEFFAYDHGLSRSQYARYEKGENLRFETLLKVVEALGVTPQEFFKGF